MDWKVFATVFGTVFLAELGDKTQLATLLFASKSAASLWTIFIAASAALVLTSAIGVAAGATLSQYVEPEVSLVRGGSRVHRHRRVDAVPSRRRRELTRRDSVAQQASAEVPLSNRSAARPPLGGRGRCAQCQYGFVP